MLSNSEPSPLQESTSSDAGAGQDTSTNDKTEKIRIPDDALPSHAKERRARPYKTNVDHCARIVRETFSAKGRRHIGFGKTAGTLMRKWLQRQLDGYDKAFISAAGIGKATKQAERTVQRHLADLAKMGTQISSCPVCGDRHDTVLHGGRHIAAQRDIDLASLLGHMRKAGLNHKVEANFIYHLNTVLRACGSPLFIAEERLAEAPQKYVTKPFRDVPISFQMDFPNLASEDGSGSDQQEASVGYELSDCPYISKNLPMDGTGFGQGAHMTQSELKVWREFWRSKPALAGRILRL